MIKIENLFYSHLVIGIMVTVLVGGLSLISLKKTYKTIGILFTIFFISWLAGIPSYYFTIIKNWEISTLVSILLLSHFVHYKISSMKYQKVINNIEKTQDISYYENINSSELLNEIDKLLLSEIDCIFLLDEAANLLLNPNHNFYKIIFKKRKSNSQIQLLTNYDFDHNISNTNIKIDRLKNKSNLLILNFGDTIFFSSVKNLNETPIWKVKINSNNTNDFAKALKATSLAFLLSNYNEKLIKIEVISTASDYHNNIVKIEDKVKKVDKLVKRISIVLKSEEMTEYIAHNRYGKETEMFNTYLNSHHKRKLFFYNSLQQNSLSQREITSLKAIKDYITKQTSKSVPDEYANHVINHTKELIRVLRTFPNNYSLGLINEKRPFRYSIYDKKCVVMHEAVGQADMHRINSLIIEEAISIEAFQNEFDFLWQSIPNSNKNNKNVANIIEKILASAIKKRV